ncbi:MAG: GDSL-type esterase/lipase family protein [Elusimicrobiota bacterium]|jgi:lysophospholipase L1-like esterase
MGPISARSVLLKACLAAGGIAAAVLLMEAALRVATGRRFLDKDLRLKTEGMTYQPRQKARWAHIEWDTVVEINSEGFRDQEHAGQPEQASVVALGDSFTEGYGVDLDKSYSKVVESLLKQAGFPYRVYNAGLQGRSPKDYAAIHDAFFKDKKDVRLVTMGFFVGDDIITPETGRITPPGRKSPVYWVKRFLCEHSVSYNLIRRPIRLSTSLELLLQRYRLIGNIPIVQHWSVYKWTSRKMFQKDWDYTLAFLRDFHEKLKKQDRRFLLIYIPSKPIVDDSQYDHMLAITRVDPAQSDRFGFARYIDGFCRKNGIAFLDLTPAFVAANKKAPGAHYFKTDGHWNQAGHRLAAEEISRFIIERKLLNRP